MSFIYKVEYILISGPTGVGKSFLACALGHQGEHRTLYYSMKLFSKLRRSKADQSYYNLKSNIERADLLILDDFSLEKLDQEYRRN